MSHENGRYIQGPPISVGEATRRMSGLRSELFVSLAESNRTHVLTAFRLMAWEDLLLRRRFGVWRVLARGLFRPASLLAQVVALQNTIMKQTEDRAHKQLMDAAQAGATRGPARG